MRKEARDGCNGRGRGLVLRGPWEVRRDSLVGEGVCVCDGRDVRAIGEVEGLCHEPMRGETRRLWVVRGPTGEIE